MDIWPITVVIAFFAVVAIVSSLMSSPHNAAEERQRKEREIICPHCQRKGSVTTRTVRLKRAHAGLLAWCLMPNHFHLLLRTGRAPLSTVMRRVLLGQLAYPAQDTAPVLAQFGRTPRAARRAYQDFVRDGLSPDTARDLDGGGLRRSAGGWEVLERLRGGRERWRFDERVLGSSAFVARVLATALTPPPAPPRTDPHRVIAQLCQRVAARCRDRPAEHWPRRARRLPHGNTQSSCDSHTS